MFNVNYYDVFYNRELEVEGYTFPKETLPKRLDSGSWRLGQGNSYSMRDLGTLSALVFFVNVMEEFIIANKDVYFYIVAKDYINARSQNPNKEITIPEMDEYGDVIAKYINEFDLLQEGFKLVENEGENDRLHHFELEDHIVDGKITTFNREYIDKMILEFLESTNSLVIKVDQEMKAHSSGYARAFETKKNINQNTMEAMKDNEFLGKYGYVEIDNDVDLNKFEKLSQEFKELSHKIYIPKADDHSFRIKKLGKHRAAGIYFSGMKSTIVDIDNPDAYIHELGHQIDYTLGKGSLISESLSFRHIIDEYKVLVRDAVNELDNDNSFKKSWFGNSSYNGDYYFQPTEIMARSFELYVEEMGVKTSFLKDKLDTPVYPKDELFIKMIVEYFDNLFSFFEPVEVKKETLAVAKPV